MSKRRVTMLAALALASMLASACSSTANSDSTGSSNGLSTPSLVATDAAPDPDAILRFSAMQARSLDPARQTTPCEVTAMRLIYDTLTQFDRENRIQPMLATSWELVEPTLLRMELRKDVTFQDGTTFDAAAVKFNIDRALFAEESTIKSQLYMVESVEVVDEFTVEFTMKQPAGGALLAALAGRPGMMASPAAFEAAATHEEFNSKPVGSGKFRVSGEWIPVESLSLRSWEGYWDESTPPLGGIDMQNIQPDALVNALNADQIDLAALSSTSQIPGVRGRSDTIVKVDSPQYVEARMFLLNATIEPLDDVRVRQAIAHALDRDAIAGVITDGELGGISQWFPEGSIAYASDLEGMFPYDPQKAKDLLAEAGLADGFKIEAVIGSTATNYIQMGELIQAQLAEVGIDMSLSKIDTAQVVPTVFGGGPTGKGAAMAVPFGTAISPEPDSFFRNLFLADGVSNNGGDEVPGLRALLDDAAATVDAEERSELYQQASKLVLEGVYEGVPLFHVPGIMAFKDYVGGIDQAETQCPANLRGVYITQDKVPASKQ